MNPAPSKPHFEGELTLSPMRYCKLWTVENPFAWCGAMGQRIEVPDGFVTDLASVPRLLWWLLPPFGSYTQAAVLHDWLYSHHRMTRPEADSILWAAMKVCGTTLWERVLIYGGVRIGGWLPFYRKRKNRR